MFEGKTTPYVVIMTSVLIILILAAIGTAFYMNYAGKKQSEEIIIYTVPMRIKTTLCNDCHAEIFKPQIMGKKFYFGTWNLNPQYLVPVVDTIGDTISIYPDKIHLPDSLELSILVDVSHGQSLNPKYIQQWAVSANTWLKLSDRTSDWITRSDVLYRIK